MICATVGFGYDPARSPPAVPEGAPPEFAMTNAVVASCVVLVPVVAVGAVGVPVRAGDADRATVLPVPVVVSATNCPLPFVPTTVAEEGGAAPANCEALVAVVAVAAFPDVLLAIVLVFAISWPEEFVPTRAAEVGGAAPANCAALVAEVADVAEVAVAALPLVLFAIVPVCATNCPTEFVPTTAAETGGALPLTSSALIASSITIRWACLPVPWPPGDVARRSPPARLP